MTTTAQQYTATFGTTDNNLVSEIKSNYYGIGDNLYGLVDKLREAASSNPGNKAIEHELKTFEALLDGFRNNSDLGRIL
jgi:hypothetical protein